MDLGTVFFWIIIGCFVLLMFYVTEQNKDTATNQFRHMIESTGAKRVVIDSRYDNLRALYTVLYIDAYGRPQVRNARRDMGMMGVPTGDYYWDKPLESSPPALPSPSKEQLVSEMSIEIRRLQRQLAAVKAETGVYHG